MTHWCLHTNDPEITQWLILWRIKHEMHNIERNSIQARKDATWLKLSTG